MDHKYNACHTSTITLINFDRWQQKLIILWLKTVWLCEHILQHVDTICYYSNSTASSPEEPHATESHSAHSPCSEIHMRGSVYWKVIKM